METVGTSQTSIVRLVHFKYYRHATFRLGFTSGKNILVDPMYAPKGTFPPIPSALPLRRNPLEDFPGEFPEISKNDILLITHHHFDHFDKLAAKNLPKLINVVSPANGLHRLEGLGFQNIHALRPGQELTIQSFNISAIPVRHAQRLRKLLYKPGIGYIVRDSATSIYISGDTVCADEAIAVLKKLSIDLAILYGGGATIPIVGRHTFSHQEVVAMVKTLSPRKTIVVHLDSLNHCRETRADLKRAIEAANLHSQVSLPLPGEEISFP